ncbi:MAG: tRNA (adenine-N1)-methyltransferase [Candidatus Heimdallarchaeota archaeon]
MTIIRENDHVLLCLEDKRKSWLVKIEKGKEFHTHRGIIDLEQAIGCDYGSRIQSRVGTEFLVLDPLPSDYAHKFFHRTQVLFPKDIAMIILFGGIGPGCQVIEAGTGSGSLTASLAYQVHPDGRIYTYDIREKNAETARNNLEKVKLDQFVDFKVKDAKRGFDETDVDVVVIDLGDPWEVVPAAAYALRGGGRICIFVPNWSQVERTVTALKTPDFGKIEIFESLKRDIIVGKDILRPATRMIGFTGFLLFARKLV